MNFTKQSLKAAVIKVFEDKCNLDNYEFATLVDMFEAFRELKAEHAELQYLCSQRRFGLEGILSFLTAAQHIAPEQAEALTELLNSIRLAPPPVPETDEPTQAALDELRGDFPR